MGLTYGNLSFKTIFSRYGKTIVTWLKRNIEIGGKEWQPFVPPTTKNRNGKGSLQRMMVTGKTAANAFKFKATDKTLTIEVPSAKYSNIIEGNNKDSPFRRANQVALFPTDVSVNTFEQTKMVQDLKAEVTKEIQAYFQNVLDVDISQTIKI
jgi:hypothetical protein